MTNIELTHWVARYLIILFENHSNKFWDNVLQGSTHSLGRFARKFIAKAEKDDECNSMDNYGMDNYKYGTTVSTVVQLSLKENYEIKRFPVEKFHFFPLIVF